jgi:hypothetical protein
MLTLVACPSPCSPSTMDGPSTKRCSSTHSGVSPLNSSTSGPLPINGRSGSWPGMSLARGRIGSTTCSEKATLDQELLPRREHHRSRSPAGRRRMGRRRGASQGRSGTRGRAQANVDHRERLPSTLDRRGAERLGRATGENAPPRLDRVARDGARPPPRRRGIADPWDQRTAGPRCLNERSHRPTRVRLRHLSPHRA